MKPVDHFNVLFVDDQECAPDAVPYRNRYGSIVERRDSPYRFEFATALISPGRYGIEPVMKRVAAMPQLNAVVLDVMFGEDERLGLDILEAIRAEHALLPIFMMTHVERQNEIGVIERAMELGANEYLDKFVDAAELKEVFDVYLDPSSPRSDQAIWGNSKAIRALRARIVRLAIVGHKKAVFVIGETGTGKELVAAAIHRQGLRRHCPYFAINCGSGSGDMMRSELFGHVRGAFTGAIADRIGVFEEADGGVIFLDEIQNMDDDLQRKLLRVLEAGEISRVGENKTRRSDFQLICATNQDPKRLVTEGRLREDLYYRIQQNEIHMPPLRERPDDIPLLAELFFGRCKLSAGAACRAERITGAAMDRLKSYRWPGNVRMLKHCIEHLVIDSSKDLIDIEEVMPFLSADQSRLGDGCPLGETIDILPENPSQWAKARLAAELRLAIESLRRSKSIAEFARRLYPHSKRQSSAALEEVVSRLQRAPWGDPTWECDPELVGLFAELRALAEAKRGNG